MNSKRTSGAAQQLSKPAAYKSAAKALRMKTGNFLINYHGFCLFVDKRMNYLPWIKTKTIGILPPTQEYGRLHALGCEEFTLTKAQEVLVWAIVRQLQKNPLYLLSRSELLTVKQAQAKRALAQRHEMSVAKKTPTERIFHSFDQLQKLA